MLTIKKIMEMMKKILMMAILCLVFATSGFAQFKRSAFNHVGLNAGVGTEGISIGVAAPISNFVELEAGVDIRPKILKISGKANITTDASIIVQGQTVRIPDSEVDIDADFSRTAFLAKANIYPFGGNSKFFVAAGFAFGGAKLAKLSGHSDDLAQFISKYPEYSDEILKNVGAELSDTISSSTRMVISMPTCAAIPSVLISVWDSEEWFPRTVWVSAGRSAASIWAS